MNISAFDDFAYNVSCTAAEIVQDTKDSLKKTIYIENRVNSLSFSAVEEMILDANRIVKELYENAGLNIQFACSPTSFLNVFWRLSLTIDCTITHSDSEFAPSHRILTLRQFHVLYQEIKRFSQIPTKTRSGKPGPLLDEVCLLCCDACPSAILPCGHNFCRKCIDEWLKASFKLPPERHDSFTTRRYSCPPPLKNRQQCPLCRGPCPRSAEAWDLVGPPDDLECRKEMSLVLLNLIYNAGISSHPGH